MSDHQVFKLHLVENPSAVVHDVAAFSQVNPLLLIQVVAMFVHGVVVGAAVGTTVVGAGVGVVVGAADGAAVVGAGVGVVVRLWQ